MKYIYLLSFIFFANYTNAQFSVNASYSLGIPQKEMAQNINAVHGIYIGGQYTLPKNLNNISVGLTTGFGSYANLIKETTFTFNDNSITTDVTYSSKVSSTSAFVKMDVIKNFSITPYAMISGGSQKFYSSIRIADPEDEDDCKPLEVKTIMSDRTAFYGLGGGAKIDMGIFGLEEKKHFIDISLSWIRGGKIDYINTRKLKDSHEHEADMDMPEKGKPLNVSFINVSSNLIHEHKVAEIYTTPLRLMDIKVSYFYSF